MDVISAKDAAKKWGVTQRRISTLCSRGRIPGAVIVGNSWVIPGDAEKPEDARANRYNQPTENTAKPFLKWAGGKSQLIDKISAYYPFDTDSTITKYAEPFVGGGAVLFDILNKYKLEEIYIGDINYDLINAYTIVKEDVDGLISMLKVLEDEYLPLNKDERLVIYKKNRERFNVLRTGKETGTALERAALMIFLNRTCFNGLFRVNRKGEYNVPMGAYKNPCICDENNLRTVSEKLKNATIMCGHFRESNEFIDEHTFVYFDPPYRPLPDSSSFTAYDENGFNDESQIELANYVQDLDARNVKIVLSNSDPKNVDENDNFFDDLYAKQHIHRVEASRMINSNASGRGKIKELLVTNIR